MQPGSFAHWPPGAGISPHRRSITSWIYTDAPNLDSAPEDTPRTHDPSSSTALNYTGSSERPGSKGQRRVHGRTLLTLSTRTLLPRVGRVRCLLLLLCWTGSPQNSLPWESAMTV
jgi:hypothetical protein